MMKRITFTKIFLVSALTLFSVLGYAATVNNDNNSWFLSVVEKLISAPNRQIHISNMSGTLSSIATIGLITVADGDGVWLKIKNAKLDWNRLALLRGQISVNKLSADEIDFYRKPLPNPKLPSPEAGGFSLPALPVAIRVETLEAKAISFGEQLFGLASKVSARGTIILASGKLNSKLDIERLDGIGHISLLADYANDGQQLKLNVTAAEDGNGIIANVLKIEKRPPLSLTLSADGQLTNLKGQISMLAGSSPVLTGTLTTTSIEESTQINARLSGPISLLMPELYQPFFGAKTSFTLSGSIPHAGGFVLDQLTVKSASVAINMKAKLLADGFLRRLMVDARVAADGGSILLPIKGGETRADNIEFHVNYGESGQDRWHGQLSLKNLTTARFSAGDVKLDMGGESADLDDPLKRRVAILIKGGAHQITTKQVEIANALGRELAINFDGLSTAQQPFIIHSFSAKASGLDLWLKGEIAQLAFDGSLGINAKSLAPIGVLINRQLSGEADLQAQGRLALLTGAFDLRLEGKTQSVKTGNKIVDRLLQNKVTLSGALVRNREGFRARNFKLGNQTMMVSADGTISMSEADMDLKLALSDLALVNPKLSGPVTIDAAVRGHNSLIAFSANGRINRAKIDSKELKNFEIAINLMLDNTSPIRSYLSGRLSGTGFFDREPLSLKGSLYRGAGEFQLSDLNLTVGDAQLVGNLTHTSDGLFNGQLHLNADDIKNAAALLLIVGKGSAHADAVFEARGNQQNLAIKADANQIFLLNNQVRHLNIDAHVADVFGLPHVSGKLAADTIKVANFVVNEINANAMDDNGQTRFDAKARVDDRLTTNISGSVFNDDNAGWTLALQSLKLNDTGLNVQLTNPIRASFSKAAIAVRDLALTINNGSLTLNGTVGDRVDLKMDANKVPLNIINVIKPTLAASGTISGTVRAVGNKDDPNLNFDLRGDDLGATLMPDKSLRGINVHAQGATENSTLKLKSEISGSDLSLNAIGAIGFKTQTMDIDLQLVKVPLALGNIFIKNQNASGRITGNAHLTGPWRKPAAQFNLNGQALSATVLTANGLAPIDLTVDGASNGSILTVKSLSLKGPQSLNLQANGQMPLSGPGLDISIRGAAPLGLANKILSERGAKLSGIATLNLAMTGSVLQPKMDGNFIINNAQFIDAQTNLHLNRINVDGVFSGEKIVLRSLSAASAAGGSLSATGNVSTDIANGMPANIAAHFNDTRYSDGKMVVATINGNINVTGPLLRNPVIGGQLTLEKAEITIPDHFGSATLIDVKHKNATAPIIQTLTRADMWQTKDNKAQNSAASGGPTLQLHIMAPNQIFVRGMGLDIELGGAMTLTGPISDIHPVGGFNMIRGRFDILSQRLTFNEGKVTLVGNLSPELNFSAQTEGSDIVVTVRVSGTADNIKVAFSSQPSLPQDEVLARLIFNRSIGELSPFQIAQLASAAAQLTGITSTSLMTTLRNSTGLDDLNIITDSKGNTGISAGRYIQDNIYLGVEAGSGDSTKGTINLDISKHVKAKGALSAEGNSSVGVFYEKDY